jgi:hypothetical protein
MANESSCAQDQGSSHEDPDGGEWGVGTPGSAEETDRVMNDGDWLTQVFERAEREYHELPEWARPVHTPPVAAAYNDPADTDTSTEEQTSARDKTADTDVG